MEEKINGVLDRLGSVEAFLSEILKEKDGQITDLTGKLIVISKEKDDALMANFDLMKQFSLEREDLFSQISKLNTQIQESDHVIKSLKQKSKAAQDGLIGSSFEMDRIKKEVDEKDRQIQEIVEKVASVSSGSTGILYDIASSVTYMKERIQIANRSLRIVVPTIKFLADTGLMQLLDKLPESSVVNIAIALDLPQNKDLVDVWKERGWFVYNYPDQNFLMCSANGADVSIAFYNEGNVSGFYSNIQDLITIFKQALMYPFIKAQKL